MVQHSGIHGRETVRMTSIPTPSADALIQRARDLGPAIRACREEIDATRQLPTTLVQALRAAGMFRLFVPAKLGGYEIDPITFVKIIEELSAVDGSVGWIVSVCAVGGLLAGSIREEALIGIYGESPDTIIAGGVNPTGRAVVVDGGYLVSGRWAFGSGIRHANWVYGNCLIYDGEQKRLDATNNPEARVMLFPATVCVVHDTWQVGGLRGTGSHDFSVSELFVPADRSLIAFSARASQPGILYKFPFSLFAVLIAAVPLGIARGAIGALVELAKAKRPMGGSVLLSEKPSVQIAVARAKALVCTGRAFLYRGLKRDARGACGLRRDRNASSSGAPAGLHAGSSERRPGGGPDVRRRRRDIGVYVEPTGAVLPRCARQDAAYCGLTDIPRARGACLAGP